MKHSLFIFFLLTSIWAKGNNTQGISQVNIIPQPNSVTYNDSHFVLTKNTVIYCAAPDSMLHRTAEYLQQYIQLAMGVKLDIQTGDKDSQGIVLSQTLTGASESYNLSINSKQVLINGVTEQGVFWGIQSLRQIIPAKVSTDDVSLPGVEIKDEPRFSYRGVHLDVARHFFGVKDIKKYIDILALHKIAYFHWHLTDDQGWRIEIKKYPLLTQVGSKRDETLKDKGPEYDGIPYGGFYTQEEAKDIVRYAASQFITIIPEFDLPGHTVAALTSYPQLGCTGGPYHVRKKWGVADDVLCAGNPDSYKFVTDVMDELMDIFPGPYIHLGGDECPKTRWKKCPKCQALEKKEHLKNEEELQNYFIGKVAKYLQSKGRTVIGWDEILEGGLIPNTTIMSWRGTKGGIEAAKEHHNAIMTPGNYAYFDKYQSTDRSTEPMAFGGYLPISKVYEFEPVPKELTPEESKYIIGAQANLWAEYMPDFKKNVEYMLLPRLAAMSEVLWTHPQNKDWTSFKHRLVQLTSYYDALDLNYAKHLFDADIVLTPNYKSQEMEVSISTMLDQATIYYTTDGSTPNTQSPRYVEPLHIKGSATIKAMAVIEGQTPRVKTAHFVSNLAAFKPATTTSPIEKRFQKALPNLFTDLIRGGDDFGDGKWVGLAEDNIAVTIDLGAPTTFSKVTVGGLVDPGSGIVGPVGIEVYGSTNGKKFKLIKSEKLSPTTMQTPRGSHDYSITFKKAKSRYVKVVTVRQDKMPVWQGGGKNSAYLFVDEIRID